MVLLKQACFLEKQQTILAKSALCFTQESSIFKPNPVYIALETAKLLMFHEGGEHYSKPDGICFAECTARSCTAIAPKQLAQDSACSLQKRSPARHPAHFAP
jgi:hypothetical protein